MNKLELYKRNKIAFYHETYVKICAISEDLIIILRPRDRLLENQKRNLVGH